MWQAEEGGGEPSQPIHLTAVYHISPLLLLPVRSKVVDSLPEPAGEISHGSAAECGCTLLPDPPAIQEEEEETLRA